MTQEDKELLFKDLCMRLPYGVIMTNKKFTKTHYPLTCEDLRDAMFDESWDDVPYLRQIMSMTEKEDNDYRSTWRLVEHGDIEDTYEPRIESYDWLNANHFDYRGLIERGLALEAPSNMYNN